jgi:hypothetical protein
MIHKAEYDVNRKCTVAKVDILHGKAESLVSLDKAILATMRARVDRGSLRYHRAIPLANP